MLRFPFYGFPFNFGYPYYNYSNKNLNSNQNLHIKNTVKNENSITNSLKFSNTINQSSNNNSPIFEVFGIKLYLDDLIILGLLFLLYQENVHDDMLYIVLFLLLFS